MPMQFQGQAILGMMRKVPGSFPTSLRKVTQVNVPLKSSSAAG
jgi:hypothetical protein